MSLVIEIKQICQKYNFKPLRKRGQNFLINPKIYAKIIEAAELKKDDIVLEIGPGLGTLTQELAKRVKKVIAVEIDKKLVEILKERLQNYHNIDIIQEDILKIKDLRPQTRTFGSVRGRFKIKEYKVVANLPYNITGAVLRQFLSVEKCPSCEAGFAPLQRDPRQFVCWPQPTLMVLMVQKEVGQRICAQPPKMSLLSVMVQFYAQPKIISYVSKNNFWPRPRVDSAILRITTRINADQDADQRRYTTQINADRDADKRRDLCESAFFEVVRAGFSSPRKFLLNNLVKSGLLKKEEGGNFFQELNFNPKIRAQELSVEDWIKLYNKMQIYKSYANIMQTANHNANLRMRC
jgi:16S rRNA (adenine1518-N6/adenine1519-N6)-dimethyltransferase